MEVECFLKYISIQSIIYVLFLFIVLLATWAVDDNEEFGGVFFFTFAAFFDRKEACN